jgi:hypothetical protein
MLYRGGIALTGCQPRNLASLMELYESSYARLRRVIPDLSQVPDRAVSRVAGALDLHLVVESRHKFTTELLLTYRFPTEQGAVCEPDLRVRVYHDARVAEAMSGHRRQGYQPRHHCWRRQHPSELEAKWELNRFLQRWLGYLWRQGHLFLPLRAGGAAQAERAAVLADRPAIL